MSRREPHPTLLEHGDTRHPVRADGVRRCHFGMAARRRRGPADMRLAIPQRSGRLGLGGRFTRPPPHRRRPVCPGDGDRRRPAKPHAPRGSSWDAVTSFAYPFGYYSKQGHAAVRDAGFSQAGIVSGQRDRSIDDRWRIPRAQIGPGMHRRGSGGSRATEGRRRQMAQPGQATALAVRPAEVCLGSSRGSGASARPAGRGSSPATGSTVSESLRVRSGPAPLRTETSPVRVVIVDVERSHPGHRLPTPCGRALPRGVGPGRAG